MVVNALDESVSVLDAASGRLLRTVPVGAGPDVPVVDALARYVVVVNEAAATVSVLDARSGRVVDQLPVVGNPIAAAAGAQTG